MARMTDDWLYLNGHTHPNEVARAKGYTGYVLDHRKVEAKLRAGFTFQNYDQIKRRFPAMNTERMKPGSVIVVGNHKALDADWHPFEAWREKDKERHFGVLCIVAKVEGQDRYKAWEIEKLRRPGENTGTNSVETKGWEGEFLGRSFNVWDVIFEGKKASPHRGTSRRPEPGSLMGFYVGAWPNTPAWPNSTRHRSDILPFRYPEVEAPAGPTNPLDPVGFDELRRIHAELGREIERLDP